MKKLFFSVMLVAAALVGCTSDNEVKPNAGEVGAGEKGFVGFSIQLPTTSGTRANDKFDDGEPVPAEYKVNNATLFLFAGETEAEAKFVAAYPMNITSFDKVGTNKDQCTTEGIITSEISKPAETNLYAFVMLNQNGMYSANSLNGTALTAGTTTFADFSKIELTALGTEGNLLMTNAPVSNKTAGAAAPEEGAEITVLAKLDANKIYATQAKAQANPAGEVYVERAAAKITVSTSVNGNADSDEAAIDADANVKYSKASIKWAVNNVNEKYYNARQMKTEWLPLFADDSEGITVNASTKYRFASGAAIHQGVVRTYWAEDMNYSNDDQTFTTNPTKDQIKIEASAGKSVYVTENTFDVAHQKDMYTTGLSVSATFNGGKDFYIASTYGDNNILQATGAEGTGEKVQDYISKYLYNNNNDFKAWIDDKGTNAAQFSVTMTNDAVNGTASVASVSGTEIPSSIDAAYINNLIKFKYYAGGVAYYNVLIKHFGDSETPWNSELHKVNNIEGVYGTDPTATANFLGRYGIVRNNWYKIDIQGISQIGDPIVVTPGDTPDDKVKNYISVKIHILPWAVREQSVIL